MEGGECKNNGNDCSRGTMHECLSKMTGVMIMMLDNDNSLFRGRID